MRLHALAPLVIAASIVSGAVRAQDQVQLPIEPPTRLEALEARTGVIMLMTFDDVGVLRGQGHVSVQARKCTDVTSGQTEMGLVLEVREGTRSSRSYIDYDELAGLLRGMDYMSKQDASISNVPGFQVTFRTKDYFEVTVFSAANVLKAAISSSRVGKASALVNPADLSTLRTLIETAKARLDALR